MTGVTTTSAKIIVTGASVQFTSGSQGLAASDGNPYLTVGVGIITVASAEARIQNGFNLKVGGVPERSTTGATNAIYLINGTAPVGTLANGVNLYSSGGKLFAMDAAGAATQLTP